MILGTLNKLIFILFFFISISINAKPIEGEVVEIQILDKITAKVTNFNIKNNTSIKFGSLLIEIYTCYVNPPEEIPEDYVLLKIFDNIQSSNVLIYQGWMISSSPATTPLEHPIYDLSIKDCKMNIDF